MKIHKKNDVWEQLASLGKLQIDYDERGSQPPSSVAIAIASQFILKATSMGLDPTVGPDAMGGVAVYFNTMKEERFAWAQFMNSGHTSVLFSDNRMHKIVDISSISPINMLDSIEKFLIEGEFPI